MLFSLESRRVNSSSAVYSVSFVDSSKNMIFVVWHSFRLHNLDE
jgi:hypothetical protein